VLLVPEGVEQQISQKDGQEAKEDVLYYIVNNEIGTKFGEVCTGAKKTQSRAPSPRRTTSMDHAHQMEPQGWRLSAARGPAGRVRLAGAALSA
jgi:hypothetical protein